MKKLEDTKQRMSDLWDAITIWHEQHRPPCVCEDCEEVRRVRPDVEDTQTVRYQTNVFHEYKAKTQ